MNHRGLFILLALAVATAGLGCSIVGEWSPVRGSGHVATQEREVSGFTSVAFASTGNLYVEAGDQEGLRIEAEDNLLPYFEVGVSDGVLEIRQNHADVWPTHPVNFYLAVKELDTIAMSGSGHVEASALESEQFFVDLSGSGDVQLGGLRANTLDVVVSGSGSLDIAGGEVETQDVTLSGSGSYSGKDLASAEATAHVSGSGSATIQARDRLEATVSGSGSVRYVGNPVVRQAVSGSGEVVQIGE